MEAEIASALAQFGVAGMVGWMWLAERRAAATREEQLGRAHDKLMRQGEQLGVLMELTRANTRAMAGLEATQREMVRVLDALGRQLHGSIGQRVDGVSEVRGGGDSRHAVGRPHDRAAG